MFRRFHWTQFPTYFGDAHTQLNPRSAEAHSNLGLAEFDAGNLAQAIEHYRCALQLEPNLAEAHLNLAHALHELGMLDQAFVSYQQALLLHPEFADAHTGLATLRLLQGDFPSGWPGYEWRFKTQELKNSWANRDLDLPRWNGSSLSGKTILLQAEQGLGDTIQFVRYAAVLKTLNAITVVECQKSLVPLLASCGGIDKLIAQGEQLPALDVRVPLLSIPGILKTSLESTPAAVPYLFADESLVIKWRNLLQSVAGFRIGINWRSKPGPRNSWQRNLPLECFESLRQVPNLQLLSLQHGVGMQELKQGHDRLNVLCPGDDIDKQHGAFMDTAAIMMNLDLVITSDTSIAHLAGALGVPVWVALPFVPDWRWLLHRKDSTWYPTMRLFRQHSPSDWNTVFQEMQTALQEISFSGPAA